MFASPSEKEVLTVARAAASASGGVLFTPINYAGDILNFGAAGNVTVTASRSGSIFWNRAVTVVRIKRPVCRSAGARITALTSSISCRRDPVTRSRSAKV